MAGWTNDGTHNSPTENTFSNSKNDSEQVYDVIYWTLRLFAYF